MSDYETKEAYYEEFGTDAGRRRRTDERARVHGELARAKTYITEAIGLLHQARQIANAENYEGTAGYIDEAITAAEMPESMIVEELTEPLRLSFGDRWFDEHLWPEWEVAAQARAAGKSGKEAAQLADQLHYRRDSARE